MIYRLRDILEFGAQREIRPGVWVAARPLPGPLPMRLRAAWEVLCGRADALTWPVADDSKTWCAVPHSHTSSGVQRGGR